MPVRFMRIGQRGNPTPRVDRPTIGNGPGPTALLEKLLQLFRILGNIFLQRDIGAVERNDARFIPALDEGQQMHTGVAKINMHQIRSRRASNEAST